MSPRLLFILILAIAGAALYSQKDRFKSMSSRNQFLTLLLCYYAIPVISCIFTVLGYAWNTHEFQDFINSDYIFILFFLRILSIAILILMLIGKGYGTGRKYRTGLMLLVTGQTMALILMIIEKTSESLVLQIGTFAHLIYIASSIMITAGMILFILSSLADRKLKIFVISAIFLPGALNTLMMVLLVKMIQNTSGINYNITLSLGNLLIMLGVFITACILVRKSMRSEIDLTTTSSDPQD